MEVVKQAYISKDLPLPDHVTAFEVRALSASWAYASQVSLEDVMSAIHGDLRGCSKTVISVLSLCVDGMRSLGLLVVAQIVTGRR